MIILFGET